MFSHIPGLSAAARCAVPLVLVSALAARASAQEPVIPQPAPVQSTGFGVEPTVHRIQSPNERMEMTANSSRVITIGQNIPRAQVNNRDVLELTALSPTEVQVFAKKPGVTQINLWNDKGQIYTIDTVVYGDARELFELIRSEFPNANIRVKPLASSVWLSGYVDRPDQVSQIITLAQDYYPTVKSNIEVVGVQQILLHVKVAEVSRTKLRNLGFDFANLHGDDFVVSSVSGLIGAFSSPPPVVTAANDTVRFGIVDGNNAFFGFLEAMRRNDLLKILADPTLVTVSGRPAFFNVGGEFPILVPQSLGTVSIEYKKFGTQLDFVPIVLGNGNIRLEVRPRVSEVDPTRSIVINGTTVPGLRVREADTGVEMRAGQTLAIAGLVQTREEAQVRGIPWLSELPWIGAGFRRMHDEVDEVELLILVTPELAQAVNKCDAPRCFPGMHTDSPNDCEFYWKGYLEVPSRGPCGPNGGCGYGPEGVPAGGMSPEGVPGGSIIQQRDDSSGPTPAPAGPGPAARSIGPAEAAAGSVTTSAPSNPPDVGYSSVLGGTGGGNGNRQPLQVALRPTPGGTTQPTPGLTPPNPTNNPNRYSPLPTQDQRPAGTGKPAGTAPGFIGPVGYDVLN